MKRERGERESVCVCEENLGIGNCRGFSTTTTTTVFSTGANERYDRRTVTRRRFIRSFFGFLFFVFFCFCA